MRKRRMDWRLLELLGAVRWSAVCLLCIGAASETVATGSSERDRITIAKWTDKSLTVLSQITKLPTAKSTHKATSLVSRPIPPVSLSLPPTKKGQSKGKAISVSVDSTADCVSWQSVIPFLVPSLDFKPNPGARVNCSSAQGPVPSQDEGCQVACATYFSSGVWPCDPTDTAEYWDRAVGDWKVPITDYVSSFPYDTNVQNGPFDCAASNDDFWLNCYTRCQSASNEPLCCFIPLDSLDPYWNGPFSPSPEPESSTLPESTAQADSTTLTSVPSTVPVDNTATAAAIATGAGVAAIACGSCACCQKGTTGPQVAVQGKNTFTGQVLGVVDDVVDAFEEDEFEIDLEDGRAVTVCIDNTEIITKTEEMTKSGLRQLKTRLHRHGSDERHDCDSGEECGSTHEEVEAEEREVSGL